MMKRNENIEHVNLLVPLVDEDILDFQLCAQLWWNDYIKNDYLSLFKECIMKIWSMHECQLSLNERDFS